MILKSPNQLGHFAPIKQSMDREGDNDVSGYPGNIIDKHESEVRRTSVVLCVFVCSPSKLQNGIIAILYDKHNLTVFVIQGSTLSTASLFILLLHFIFY